MLSSISSMCVTFLVIYIFGHPLFSKDPLPNWASTIEPYLLGFIIYDMLLNVFPLLPEYI